MTERLHFHFSLSCFGERKWQPTPVFLPGESQGVGEPGGLPSMALHGVGHDWSDLAAAAAATAAAAEVFFLYLYLSVSICIYFSFYLYETSNHFQ